MAASASPLVLVSKLQPASSAGPSSSFSSSSILCPSFLAQSSPSIVSTLFIKGSLAGS